MKKIYSKSDLAKKSEKVFKNYPNAKKAFLTNDGNGFLDENRASLHTKSYKDGQYFEFENEKASNNDSDDTGSEGSNKPKTAQELIDDSKTMDLETAQETLKNEKAGEKPRSTVIKALESRIEELKQAE